MAAWIVRGNQSRAVPDESVPAYVKRGWTVQDDPEPEPFEPDESPDDFVVSDPE